MAVGPGGFSATQNTGHAGQRKRHQRWGGGAGFGSGGGAGAEPHLVQGFHDTHHVVKDDHGLPLAEPLLLDDVVLQVDEVGGLVAEVVCTEAIQDEADALPHLLHHPAGFRVLDDFTGAVLGGKGADQGLAMGPQVKGWGSGTLLWSQRQTPTWEPARAAP